jgi:hypothetical protein
MRAGTRVALYGLLLVALFVVSALLADLLVPATWVESWSGSTP